MWRTRVGGSVFGNAGFVPFGIPGFRPYATRAPNAVDSGTPVEHTPGFGSVWIDRDSSPLRSAVLSLYTCRLLARSQYTGRIGPSRCARGVLIRRLSRMEAEVLCQPWRPAIRQANNAIPVADPREDVVDDIALLSQRPTASSISLRRCNPAMPPSSHTRKPLISIAPTSVHIKNGTYL